MRVLTSAAVAAVLLLGAFAPVGAQAPAPGVANGVGAVGLADTHMYVLHSWFFSLETKQTNLIDPQVFVADTNAAPGPGPQGIVHVAGYRPAFAVDAPELPLTNANGLGIRMTLGQWLGARGSLVLVQTPRGTGVASSFSGLVPRGRYSLFENHFSPNGTSFTPLDGTGRTNSFTASPDGTAQLTVFIPGAITHNEAVLLVYHSDGIDHGMDRGQIGVDAHHQLIFRLP